MIDDEYASFSDGDSMPSNDSKKEAKVQEENQSVPLSFAFNDNIDRPKKRKVHKRDQEVEVDIELLQSILKSEKNFNTLATEREVSIQDLITKFKVHIHILNTVLDLGVNHNEMTHEKILGKDRRYWKRNASAYKALMEYDALTLHEKYMLHLKSQSFSQRQELIAELIELHNIIEYKEKSSS
jgi:hypothetical protein